MSQNPANPPPSGTSAPPAQASSRADMTENLAIALKLFTDLGGAAPPPAGPIIGVIGQSAMTIIETIKLYMKNKADADKLLSDIESAISFIYKKAQTASVLASPEFRAAIDEYQTSLKSLEDSLPPKPKSRHRFSWRRFKVFFKARSIQAGLVSLGERLKEAKEKLQASQQWEIQHRVEHIDERHVLLDQLCPVPKEDVLDVVAAWVKDPDARNILWINGSPGAGKSAVAASVDLAPLGHHDFYAAFRDAILAGLKEKGFDAGDRDLVAQFRFLIQGPLTSLAMARYPVVVIDALDECGAGTDTVVKRFLETLGLWGSLPRAFKLVVTSRDVQHISEVLTSISVIHTLPTGGNVSDAASADIQLYLSQSVSWADKDAQYELQRRAAGLFIWVTTAVKFMEEGFKEDRLKQILSSPVLDEAFGKCNQGEIDQINHILAVLILAKTPVDRETLLHLSGVGLNVLNSVLERLKPILTTASPMGVLTISHLSASEYFLGFESQRFHVDENTYSLIIAEKCLKIMNSGLKFNICSFPTSYMANQDVEGLGEMIQGCIPNWLAYACQFWSGHIRVECAIGELVKDMKELFETHFLHWLEVLSLLQKIDSIFGALSIVINRGTGDEWLLSFARDCWKFVVMFKPAISKSVPHIYVSGLALAPTNSMISKHYYKQFSRLLSITGGMEEWPVSDVYKMHDDVHTVAYSPDGKYFASGSADNSVRVWDAATGTQILLLQGHDNLVTSAAYSPDGRHIASGSADNSVRVWDATTGTQISLLQGHDDAVSSVAYSPDGGHIASGSHDKSVRVWDAAIGTQISLLQGHDDLVISVAYSPDGGTSPQGLMTRV
ncbi:hypothetical protein BD779DRAFT_1801647 [Infundibulicybe gibba]|nr:hypothetical protein BD779DRAFT_1801647 [Infundibulicybe gibba]